MSGRVVAVLVALSLPCLAYAGDHTDSTPEPIVESDDGGGKLDVLGGGDAPAGKWPDVAAVLFGGEQGCTGTLIAPRWAITAGHCDDTSLNAILVGTTSLARPSEGETINVIRRIPYPNWERAYDITLLELERDSVQPPRTIASGWARFDIKNGAQVALVGYGAVDRNANQYIDELQEAVTTITDADCSASAGCEPNAMPNGELGAGGGGIDTCPGDSGGPLYLLTDYGAFLAGATSRTYDNPRYYCTDGGIYVRPDKLIPWFEEQIGAPLPKGPMPSADVLTAESGGDGSVKVEPNDPHAGVSHFFEVVTQGAHGTAVAGDDGTVVFNADADYLGADTIEVKVTDAADSTRSITITVAVDVVEPTDDGGCGCRTGADASGALPWLIVGAALAWRRRRRR